MPGGHDLTELFSHNGVLGSDLGDLTGTFPGLDDATNVVGSFDGTDPWGRHLFSPLSLGGPTVNTAAIGDHKLGGTHRSLSTSDDEDPVEAANAELAALNARAMRATRSLMRPGTAPLTVNSPLVNEAFEATTALIRIINSIPHISASNLPGDQSVTTTTTGQSTMTFGLVFLALASHQHLLGLFRAICDSVERSLESINTEIKQQQRGGLHGEGPSSAQFVMVLQLLMHLIGRMDRSLFNSTAIPKGEMTRSSAEQIMSSYVGGESWESQGSQCVFVLAQAIVETLPEEHVKLKRLIQILLTRMEGYDNL
ncbi:hypothetical protein GE09DRAFT_1252611 [Coniochaeta sp. 2T2.1]|nr:hypothetical protein GE09DRAFT_1252611 [Coniochaeta sp. 2T2.1]